MDERGIYIKEKGVFRVTQDRTKVQEHVKMIRQIARESWGYERSSEDEAKKKLLTGTDVSGAALIEIVRRINQAIEAWARDCFEESDRDMDLPKPGNAKPFPGAKIGDILYNLGNGLEGGVSRSVVVAVLSGDFVRTVDYIEEQDDRNCRRVVDWGVSWEYQTEAEALEKEARREIAYCKPRLEAAERVLQAIKAGEDLSQFRDGVLMDEEEN